MPSLWHAWVALATWVSSSAQGFRCCRGRKSDAIPPLGTRDLETDKPKVAEYVRRDLETDNPKVAEYVRRDLETDKPEVAEYVRHVYPSPEFGQTPRVYMQRWWAESL